ncbi:MAG: alpha/beta hydrolase [Cyanobacteria bacterium CRU_2_1]|nr:alpha/beta hydrolase [Cyanobacteria bacterium RU_5_0]NJR58223.1 alpha/beta hydrolase [Cyanobacteria bacterium CRU_2_1]
MTESTLYPFFRTPSPFNSEAPLFIYLPGMDGTGELLHVQLAGLEQGFDIRCLSIALDDLSSWEQLTEQLVSLIEVELKRQPRDVVYLCGESFGGCLALKTILRSPHLFDRLVLINPASSFKRYPWIYWGSHLVCPLPDVLYRMSCVSFLPVLAALGRIGEHDRFALLRATQSVAQNTSIWRLSLLREFTISESELHYITQPTLVVASARDSLLPSVSEAHWLTDHIPNAQMHILPNSGHACLLESDVNLYQIMQTSNFLYQPKPGIRTVQPQLS